jgi:acyl-CoA reductase-like NAD-dependent aldehyde dehydrogenase
VVAPETSSLLGLVSRLAPPLVTGNTVVLLASETRPLPAVTLTEVLATSDVPGGVVNVLTGRKSELIPVLAAHADIDALDTWGVPDDLRVAVEQSAADDIKRLLRRPTTVSETRFDWLDDALAERPEWIAAFLEMKTVWHPIGV